MVAPLFLLWPVLAFAGCLLPNGAAPTAGPGPIASATWTQWRGPTRDGQSRGPSWPATLQSEHLKPMWRVDDLGPSYAGAIVAADRVFSVETKDEAVEIVRAFDRATGRELWKTDWAGAMEVPFFAKKNGSWVRSTPAYDGERLYVGGMRGVLVCLEGATGDVVWTCSFTERLEAPHPAFGFVCSPLVTADHVFVQAGGGFVKLDKRTGEILWRTLEDGGGMNSAFASPMPATLHGREQLLVQTRTELCGVAPDDGNVLWRRPVKSFRGMNILTPSVHGDAVFTAAYGGRARLLTPVRASTPTSERGDAAWNVDEAWDLGVQGNMTSPVVINGHAYLLTRSNRFICIDLAAGEQRWISEPTGDDYWSLVARDDRILALSDSGRLRLIRATPERYDVIDEVEIADDQTWAHLAVAGNQLFVREQHGLAAYTLE